MNSAMPALESTESESQTITISISGQRLLDDPLLNKSSAFPEEESGAVDLDKLEQTVSGKMWKPHYVPLRRAAP